MRTRLLLPLLILSLAWGQEGFDQLLFAGQWNLPMGPGQPMVGGDHGAVQPCRLRASDLQQPGLPAFELAGAEPRDARLPQRLAVGAADDHSRRPVLAKPEPWTLGRGLRTARLPDRDRLAGTPHGPGGVLALRLSLDRLDPFPRRPIGHSAGCGSALAV